MSALTVIAAIEPGTDAAAVEEALTNDGIQVVAFVHDIEEEGDPLLDTPGGRAAARLRGTVGAALWRSCAARPPDTPGGRSSCWPPRARTATWGAPSTPAPTTWSGCRTVSGGAPPSCPSSCRSRSRRRSPAARGAALPAQTGMGRLICVLGPKGGTGKTLTRLQPRGRRSPRPDASVTLVDLDLQFGDVGLALGLRPGADRLRPGAARAASLDVEKLDAYLAAHPSGARALLAPVRPDQAGGRDRRVPARRSIACCASTTDYVIVDTPPGFTPEVIASIDSSSDVCLVGMLDSLSLKNTKLGLETLELMGYDEERIRLVLNRADSERRRHDHGRGRDPRAPARRAASRAHRDVARSVNEGAPIVLAPAPLGGRTGVPLARPDVRRGLGGGRGRGERERRRQRSAPGPRAPLQDRAEVAGGPPRAARRCPQRVPGSDEDAFAELKNRIHLAVIGELGPQLFDGGHRSGRGARARASPTSAAGSRRSRASPATTASGSSSEIADDILGHGPLERLLADDSDHRDHGQRRRTTSGSSAQARLHRDDGPLHRRVAPAPDHQQDRRPGRPADRRVLADGRRAPAGRQPRERGDPAAVAERAAASRSASSRRSGSTWRTSSGSGRSTTETLEFLERCVRAELNILISGGTGSGKTTLLNAMSTAIPDQDRIVTIEDAAELRLNQRHVLRLESRPKNIEGEGEIPIRDARAQLAAHAARPDHRRRGPRRRGAGHAPGDEHGPRRLAVARCTPTPPATRSRASRRWC